MPPALPAFAAPPAGGKAAFSRLASEVMAQIPVPEYLIPVYGDNRYVPLPRPAATQGEGSRPIPTEFQREVV